MPPSARGELGVLPGGRRGQAPATSDASLAIAPLTRMEEAFHPYSSYVILPLFALANAGVPVSASGTAGALSSRVGLGVFLGLVLGAPASGVLFA